MNWIWQALNQISGANLVGEINATILLINLRMQALQQALVPVFDLTNSEGAEWDIATWDGGDWPYGPYLASSKVSRSGDTMTGTLAFNVDLGCQSTRGGHAWAWGVLTAGIDEAGEFVVNENGVNIAFRVRPNNGNLIMHRQVQCLGAFAMNGKTPIANVAAPAAAGGVYGAAEQGLLNDIRTRLINLGIYT